MVRFNSASLICMVIIGVERESDDDNRVSEINAVARDKRA